MKDIIIVTHYKYGHTYGQTKPNYHLTKRHRHIRTQTDRQIDIHTQNDRQIDKQTQKDTNGQSNRHTDTDGQRRTDKYITRHTRSQNDRQIHK